MRRIILSNADSADLTGASIFDSEEFRGANGVGTCLFDGVANGQFIDVLIGSEPKSGPQGVDLIKGGGGSGRWLDTWRMTRSGANWR